MNYDVYPNSNSNALAPDVVDALMPHAASMLDIKRVCEERPMIAKQFQESLEYRKIKACCPHRHIDQSGPVTLLAKADVVTKDGGVRCKICGAPILTNWSKEDFERRIKDAVAVIDTILLYGPDFNLGNYPHGYMGDQGIIDKMIECKEFLSVNMVKISETFTSVGKAENTSQENRRVAQNYRDHTSNVTNWG